MAATKAVSGMLGKKRGISDALSAALEKVNNAASAAEVDDGIKEAKAASVAALTLAKDALMKAIAPDHTATDEDVQVELADFATAAQRAEQNVLEVAKKKKAESGWP